MEKQLFNWTDWETVDEGYFNFYDVVTRVQIGEITPNSRFECASVDYTTGVLEFYSEDSETVLHRFNLQLVIVNRT